MYSHIASSTCSEHSLSACGRVAWAQPSGPGVDEPGMGIEFLEVDDETRTLVGQMVEKLSQDLARPPA